MQEPTSTPPEYGGADIPADSPHHYSPPPSRAVNRGLLGGLAAILIAAWSYGKYLLLFALKFKAFGTLITLAISFAAYAVFWGPWFAAGLVLMILVHELGHVFEIRRQGMQASAPLFIPFMGAAIFQRSHPSDALKQAQIGIAGPIAGTLGATAAFVLYGATQSPVLLLWALVGFYINLFNLIPVGMLDGGWILAPASKWFQVAGFAALGVLAFAFHMYLSPILILIVVLGIPTLLDRWRNDQSPYYQSVPVGARWAMGGAWLALVAYLGIATLQAHSLLDTFVR